MNKYKLKKWYPSLPKDWEVGMEIQLSKNSFQWPYYIPDSKYKYQQIVNGEVENNEFWEKVVEKDYVITTVKSVVNNNIYYKLCNGIYNCWTINLTDDTVLEHIKNNKVIIHSVMRVSDGVIFSLGDRITGKSDYNCIIHTIDLNPNYPQIMFNRLDEGIDLVNAKRIKQKRFTSEDGVDIYEGDNYRCVNINTFFTHNCTCDQYSNIKDDNFKYFSTKEKAEEYILMNKPCLNLNDIEYLLPDGSSVFEKLKKVVKSRL